jgi:hypothetical protein
MAAGISFFNGREKTEPFYIPYRTHRIMPVFKKRGRLNMASNSRRMDPYRVIRVQIDHPAHPVASANNDLSTRFSGFLSEELTELENALLNGKHLEFSWLPWAAKSKESVVKNVVPSQPVTPGALEFQQQVHVDLVRLINVLEGMSKIMAGEAPQPMPAPASLPMPSSSSLLVPSHGDTAMVWPIAAKNGGSIYAVSAPPMPPLTTPFRAFANGSQCQFYPGVGYVV